MDRYADYAFYTGQYQGSTVPEAAFSSAILKASAFLNRVTFGRISEPYIEEVRCAACELAEMQYRFDQWRQEGGQEVKGENNDGFSISFVTEGVDGESKEAVLHRKMYAAAKIWLGNTDLLNLGVAL